MTSAAPYVPTLEEIAAACSEISGGWSPCELIRRGLGMTPTALREPTDARPAVTGTRRQPPRRALPDGLDITDEQWLAVEPLLPRDRTCGRHRDTDFRAVVAAIAYRQRTGCSWRALPKGFPPWGTVYDYYRAWSLHGGTLARIGDALGISVVPSVHMQSRWRRVPR